MPAEAARIRLAERVARRRDPGAHVLRVPRDLLLEVAHVVLGLRAEDAPREVQLVPEPALPDLGGGLFQPARGVRLLLPGLAGEAVEVALQLVHLPGEVGLALPQPADALGVARPRILVHVALQGPLALHDALGPPHRVLHLPLHRGDLTVLQQPAGLAQPVERVRGLGPSLPAAPLRLRPAHLVRRLAEPPRRFLQVRPIPLARQTL